MNTWEKSISILAGNLNSGLSYLITTVELYTNFILTLSGKVPSPICGQTVILAEKCEENTYTLIEPSIDQQNISPVKNGKKQPKDIQGISYWNVFYELTLTDRNMQAWFYLKVVLKFWGSDIWVLLTIFQKVT